MDKVLKVGHFIIALVAVFISIIGFFVVQATRDTRQDEAIKTLQENKETQNLLNRNIDSKLDYIQIQQNQNNNVMLEKWADIRILLQEKQNRK